MSDFTEFLSALPPPRWNTFILGPLWVTQFFFLAFRQLFTVDALISAAFASHPSTYMYLTLRLLAVLLLQRLTKSSFAWLFGIVFFLGNFALLFMPLYEAHTYGVGTLTLDKYWKSQKRTTGWIVAGLVVFVISGLSFSGQGWGKWQAALMEILYLWVDMFL